ncbi:MAG TPA: GNAT family N-acetyltransferase [Cyclobacteriaceae bacterium]|nr:GNAT family N-acetyltransferase [Cyclobacteriaceae bacterium]HRK52826.1 GNAT family N-acetyltransferase [Cyclobacteriaceae bacterium]
MTNYTFKYRTLSEVLYESLINDPFYITLEKSIGRSQLEKKEMMLRYMDYSMVEGEHSGQIFIPAEHNYGVSIWLKPMREKEAQLKSDKKEFLITHLGQNAWRCYASIVNYMSLQSAPLIPHNAWYLSIVGLEPTRQNKGLGSGLIIPVLEKTDGMGFMTYLETFTPRNMKFYEKLGYTSIASFNEPITGSPYWIMTRQPESRIQNQISRA